MEVEQAIARVVRNVLRKEKHRSESSKYIDVTGTNMVVRPTALLFYDLLEPLIPGPDDVGDILGQKLNIKRYELRHKFFLGPTSGETYTAAPCSVARIWVIQSDSKVLASTEFLYIANDVRSPLNPVRRQDWRVLFKQLYLITSYTPQPLGADTQWWGLVHDNLFLYESLFKKVQLGDKEREGTYVESGFLYMVVCCNIFDVIHNCVVRVYYEDED